MRETEGARGPAISRRMRFILGLGLILAAAALAGPAAALDLVSLQLHAAHQAQFAGFYLAQDTGIYERHGLKVYVRPGGLAVDSFSHLSQGQADFATGWLAKAIHAHVHGFPLAHLAQLSQRSSLLLVALAQSGVKSVKDLQSRKVGLSKDHSSVAPRSLFRREGITVEIIDQNPSVSPLLQGAVTARTILRFDGLNLIYLSGVDLKDLVVFDLARLGFDFPEEGLYALQATWKDRPELCRRLVKASLEGFRLAFQEPDKALAAILARTEASRAATNLTHQSYMLKEIKEAYTNGVGLDGLGRLKPEAFSFLIRAMADLGEIPADWTGRGFPAPAWRDK